MVKIKDSRILYTFNGKIYYRNKKGQIRCVNENKFQHGQIVKTSKKHYSQKTFAEVIDPTYVPERGWIYGEHFINRQDFGGGSGHWNNEDLFEEITDPSDILFKERLIEKRNISQLKQKIKRSESRLEKIEFALEIIIPDFEYIIKKCHVCGKYCRDDQADANQSICLDCRKTRDKDLKK